MEHKIIADLLSQGGYFVVNKKMMRAFGIHKTLVLGLIIDKGQEYNFTHFYCTREYMRGFTGMDLVTITKAIAFWRDCGVITSVKEGIPSKTYYTVNMDALAATLSAAFDTTSSGEKKPLTCQQENQLDSEMKNPLSYIDKDSSIKDSRDKTPKKDDTDACAREVATTETKDVDWKEVMSRWNKIADQYTMPKLLAMTPQRKINFLGTLSAMENPTVDFFFAELERIMATSYFLQGIKRVEEKDGYRTEEATSWVPSFEWFIRPGNFVKYREGKSAERSLVKKWERFHKKQTTTEKEGVKDAEKGGAL